MWENQEFNHWVGEIYEAKSRGKLPEDIFWVNGPWVSKFTKE